MKEKEAEVEACSKGAHSALGLWCWACMHKCVISPISRDGTTQSEAIPSQLAVGGTLRCLSIGAAIFDPW